MTSNAERGRLAMHVLVDILSGYDDANPDGWQTVVDAATPRLVEIEAIGVTVDETDDNIHIDLEASPLLLGGAVMVKRLVHELAAARGQDPDDVIVQLREWIDSDLGSNE